MSWIVYENEPFETSQENQHYLRRLLQSDLEMVGDRLRIVRHAGHLRLPNGQTFIIRSRKANGASLLAWLAYGDPSLSALRLLGTLPTGAGEVDFGSLVARLFCLETSRAIQASGLLRAYHRHQVRSAFVRGRIDFTTLAHAGGDLSRTPCIVFARLPQTPLNCLLSAAVAAIRRDSELRAAAGATLLPLAALLDEVPPMVDRDLLSGKRSLSRIEQGFEASVALARILIRSAGLGDGSAVTAPTFLINLARLFESSVVRALRDSHLETIVKRPVHVYRQSASGSDVDHHASMELDLLLPNVGGEAVVVDAKYKQRISAANLQQMAAYCWLTGARRAVLVVPSGLFTDRRTFLLPAGQDHSSTIRIDIAELELGGSTLSEWKAAARALVTATCGTS